MKEWQFGQILAMLLGSMPLQDLIETIVAWGEKQVAKCDKQIGRYEVSNHVKKAIHAAGERNRIMRLVQSDGADPNAATEGEPPSTNVVGAFRLIERIRTARTALTRSRRY